MIDEVRGLTEKNRTIFESILEQSMSRTDVTGACLYACIICDQTINKFTGARAVICGGDGEGDGGIFVDGAARGHYWLEVDIEGHRYIVDITADQFGLPPIIIERVEVMQQIYQAGDQSVVDRHVSEMLAELQGGAETDD